MRCKRSQTWVSLFSRSSGCSGEAAELALRLDCSSVLVPHKKHAFYVDVPPLKRHCCAWGA